MDDVLFRGKDGEGNAYVTRPVPGRRTEGIPSSVVRVRVCMGKCATAVSDWFLAESLTGRGRL